MSALSLHPAALLIPRVLNKLEPLNHKHADFLSDRNQFYLFTTLTFFSSIIFNINRDPNESDFKKFCFNAIPILVTGATCLSLYVLRSGLEKAEYRIYLSQAPGKVDLYPLFLLPGIVEAHAINPIKDARIPSETLKAKVLKICDKRNQIYIANVILVALAVFSALAFPTQTENYIIPAALVALAINAYMLREFSRLAKNQFSYQLKYSKAYQPAF